MKRKDNRHMALTHYLRADSIQVTVIQRGDMHTAFAELMPCTRWSNVVGCVTGTREDVDQYLHTMDAIAELFNLKLSLDVLREEDLQ